MRAATATTGWVATARERVAATEEKQAEEMVAPAAVTAATVAEAEKAGQVDEVGLVARSRTPLMGLQARRRRQRRTAQHPYGNRVGRCRMHNARGHAVARKTGRCPLLLGGEVAKPAAALAEVEVAAVASVAAAPA